MEIVVILLLILFLLLSLAYNLILYQEGKGYKKAADEGYQEKVDLEQSASRLAYLIDTGWIVSKTDSMGLRWWIFVRGDEKLRVGLTLNEAYERQMIIDKAKSLDVPVEFIAGHAINCKTRRTFK